MLPEGVSSAGPSVSTGRRVVDGWTGGGVNVEGSVGAFLLFLPLPSRSEMRPRPLEELFEPFAPLESLPEPDLPARRENRLSPDFPPPFPPDLPPPFPPDFGPGFELPPFPARREDTIGRAHLRTPVTGKPPMPPPASTKKKPPGAKTTAPPDSLPPTALRIRHLV